jgi:hypothetical protein
MRKRQTASILAATALSIALLTGCGEQQSDECEDTIESSAAVAALPDQFEGKVSGGGGGGGGRAGPRAAAAVAGPRAARARA